MTEEMKVVNGTARDIANFSEETEDRGAARVALFVSYLEKFGPIMDKMPGNVRNILFEMKDTLASGVVPTLITNAQELTAELGNVAETIVQLPERLSSLMSSRGNTPTPAPRG